ncbi:hypothetical protein ScPMuIL_016487 [Solemya velum]
MKIAGMVRGEQPITDSDSDTVWDQPRAALLVKVTDRRRHCVNMSLVSGVNGAINGNMTNPKKTKVASELEQFDDIFPELVESLTKIGLKDNQICDAVSWFKEVLEYNVPFGKKNRGLAVVTSYRLLVDKPTEENIKLAQILGWCVELLQAFFLVSDDVMDNSITRRGKPCWFRREGVGIIAVNDAFFIESAVFSILRKYFREKAYYVDLMDLFHETTMQTIMGQCLDLTTAPPEGTIDFSRFTLDRYSAIVKYKTAFYSFYLPVALAMYMAGYSDAEDHANAKTILLQMGHFFQVQDDYLDCFGDPEVIGKIGTDIEDNKCSWLVVQALKKMNDQQKQSLQEVYGRNDPEKVASVKCIYRELNLEKVYEEYEESSFLELMATIEKFSRNLPKNMFIAFANKIYKREK